MPLRSHLRLVTEDCDRRIQARWAEEQAEIGVLKREKQQLQRDVEASREKEKDMQAVVRAIHAKSIKVPFFIIPKASFEVQRDNKATSILSRWTACGLNCPTSICSTGRSGMLGNC